MVRGRTIAASLAVLGWFALALQLWLILQARWAMQASLVGAAVHYLSYFTVLSNILVAGVCSAHAWPRPTALGVSLRTPSAAGCASVSIALVAVAYQLLLSRLWAPQGLQWLANALLHNLLPPAFVLFWWHCLPKGRLRVVQVAQWACYPLAWYGFTLLRGWSIGVWPYPFIDASELGLARASLNALGLLGVFCLGGLALVALDRWLGLRQGCLPRAASSRQP